MYIIVVQKRFGNWENMEPCIASGSDKNCGPGGQFQVRSCIDGTVDKCIEEDRQHAIPCTLPDCPKITGTWSNEGECIASDAENPCGPSSGTQKQVRNCTDGSNDKCQSDDRERAIVCDLPDCQGD